MSFGAEQPAVLKVLVNGVDHGEHVVRVSDDGDVYLPEDVADACGLNRSGSLRSLQPLAYFTLDNNSLIVFIVANTALLPRYEHDFRYKPQDNALASVPQSAFANWSVDYTSGQFRGAVSASGNIGGWVPQADAFFSEGDGAVRGGTSLSRDRGTVRYAVGDVALPVGMLGGVKVSRDFSTSPYMRPWPEVSETVTMDSAGEVRLYVNDGLIQSRKALPGTFTLRNIPLPYGASTVTVVTAPIDGKPVRHDRRVYAARNLLTPGLSDFAYGAGWPRRNAGQASFDYGSAGYYLSHRQGVTDSFTAGASSYRLEGRTRYELEAAFVPAALGEVQLRYSEGTGRGAGTASYEFANGGWTYGGRLEYLDGRTQGGVYVSNYHPLIGNLRAEFRRRAMENVASMQYMKTLPGGVTFYGTAERGGKESRVYAGLSFHFGGGRFLSAAYRSDASREVQFQQSIPMGPGVGYTARVWENAGEVGREGRIAANMKYARFDAEHHSYGVWERNTLRASGSVVALDGLRLSRQAMQPLLVKVGGIEGVPVKVNGSLRGKTDRHGELIVPDLPAYYSSRVQIDTAEIPTEYLVERREVVVAPGLRGGTVAEFPVKKLTAAHGKVTYKGLPAELFTMRGAGIDSFTGNGGVFYLEDVPAGEYAVKLHRGEDRCSFTLTLPEGAGLVDLGTLECVPEGGPP